MKPAIHHAISLFVAFIAGCSVHGAEPPVWPGFEPSPWFDEQVSIGSVIPGVKMIVVAPKPEKLDPKRATRVIFFATPNGNTAEQTLGCKLAEGMDWHFDIQHIAAQTRKLRTISPTENIVLVCLQADILSWPAWRQRNPNNGAMIRGMVESALGKIPLKDPRVTLTCHSGGGSFLFGYINGGETIPDSVDRIVFLDANYGYGDEDRHGDKLLAWLRGDAARRFVNIAYDDREITLDGKKVVGPTGGTYRATFRMVERFKKDLTLDEATVKNEGGDFLSFTGMNGQVTLLIHPNPKNIILHTLLVGNMNGHLHSMTLGTPLEEKWGKFGGPRAYSEFIQPEPYTPRPVPVKAVPVHRNPVSGIPARSKAAKGGREFMQSIAGLPPTEREAAILAEIAGGNVPEFLRKFKEIEIKLRDDESKDHTAVIAVMPDYLAVGSDEDFVRVPMTPMTAQAVAEKFGCVLTTRKIANAVHENAEVKLDPRPLTMEREAVATFTQHHDIIESQRKGKALGLLVSGIKKDVVLTNQLVELPRKVAIFGWHKADGLPIQPLTTIHARTYVDYSHGVRLVLKEITVDGKKMNFDAAASDPKLCYLVSDEGVLKHTKYVP